MGLVPLYPNMYFHCGASGFPFRSLVASVMEWMASLRLMDSAVSPSRMTFSFTMKSFPIQWMKSYSPASSAQNNLFSIMPNSGP